jgi:Xaa-Pro aminopeptidase
MGSAQEIQNRLDELRRAMKEEGLSALLFFGSDPHNSEYAAPRWRDREWVTGFTGSAGTVVLTAGEAALWTDSRYWLQAAGQLEGSGILLMKEGEEETPSFLEWLGFRIPAEARVGTDFLTVTTALGEQIEASLARARGRLVDSGDLLSRIWHDRPDAPAEPVYALDRKYTGKSRGEKLEELLGQAEKAGADALFLSSLDEIAWLVNLRGNDIRHNPLFFSYLLVEKGDEGPGARLFARLECFSPELRELLAEEGIELHPYDKVREFLVELEGNILIDPKSLNRALYAILKAGSTKLIKADSPVVMMKAIKNPVEIGGIREALRKDGLALLRFLIRLKRRFARPEGADGGFDELSVAAMLYEERSRMDGFIGESFSPIVGFAEHGAVIHYSADEDSAFPIDRRGLLLIDSGGQYLEGTTDITRVFLLGEPTDEERYDYTMVLKAHIALASSRFPEGTPGCRVDVLARRPLWEAGLNYGHGTGHGIGAFLNVHEGPQSISSKLIQVSLKPGMVCSNEPGLYREGKHGVRLENLILTVPQFETPFGNFLGFETLTPFPFEKGLINPELLEGRERQWIDAYHHWVYQLLSPALDASEQAFLRSLTEKLQ